MNTSRLVVGLILLAIAVALFVFGRGEYATVGVVALGVLGLVSIGISRKKKTA